MSTFTNSNDKQDDNDFSRVEAGAKRLIDCLPAWQLQIEHLARVDPDFREICEDYEEVTQVLSRWRNLLSADSTNMVDVYETLLQELEAEAERYLRDLDQ